MFTISVACPRCGNPVVFSLKDNTNGSKGESCRKGCGWVTVVYQVSRGQVWIRSVR